MFKKHSGVKMAIISMACGFFCSTAMASESGPIVMGYWENWGTYQNFPMSGNAQNSNNATLNGQMTGLNAIAYAFLEVNTSGVIKFSDVWSDLNPNSPQDVSFCGASPQSCEGFPSNSGLGNFTAFTKSPVTHHVISVGGAGHDDAWENAFSHPDQFVSSLKTMVDIYKVDWLDIDYEPVGGVPAQNIQRFINLVNKIKQTIPNLNLSYTIPANANSVASFGSANWQNLTKNLNYVSIMGYDLHGAFDTSNPYTALHSALYADANDFSVDSTVKALNQAGVANGKLILGMPMYARAVGGVAASGLGQVFTESVQGDLDDAGCSTNLYAGNVCSGMIQYKIVADQHYTDVPVTVSGKIAGVYAYDASKKRFLSYDNAQSATAKAQYALDNKMAGVMFWALRFDKPVTDSQSILGAVDKVFGIVPNAGSGSDASMKLQLTNNDPKNPITITLVKADKSSYYAFPQLAKSGQTGSDVTYTDANSDNVKTLMNSSGVLVLLTPTKGSQLWCQGSLNFPSNSYHHVQVYYDSPVPNCSIN